MPRHALPALARSPRVRRCSAAHGFVRPRFAVRLGSGGAHSSALRACGMLCRTIGTAGCSRSRSRTARPQTTLRSAGCCTSPSRTSPTTSAARRYLPSAHAHRPPLSRNRIPLFQKRVPVLRRVAACAMRCHAPRSVAILSTNAGDRARVRARLAARAVPARRRAAVRVVRPVAPAPPRPLGPTPSALRLTPSAFCYSNGAA
jgi:hypothetical protein